MTDRDIVDLYWQRSESAIPETERAYGAYCHSVAFGLLRSAEDSEECLNDTWLAAWNAIPPARPGSLKAFLGKLTRNLAITRLRRLGSLKRGGGSVPLALEELSECLPGSFDPEKALERRELLRCVERFLETLPRRERTIFLGRYFYALTPEELAERLGMKSGAVKSQLYRTRKKLLETLEKEGETDGREPVSL